MRSWDIAGCEVGISQGAKLGHRRVRSWDIAGCEVETSQGVKLRHRRVRNVGAALGVFSSRCRVAAAALIAVGKVEHRGSKKTGGYYAVK